MLENIKLILDITEDSQDKLILLYIDKITNNILSYCNINELNPTLEGFIEDKVINIMKIKLGKMDVKSINRGDTSITYNVASASEYSNSPNLTESEKKFLNTYRKVRCF